MLVGELAPDSGIIRRGARVDVAYFDQQREQLDPERSVADTVNDGNDTVIINGAPRHVMGYLADFLFSRERAVSPVRILSGGERNRLMLARLFARPANVLVMDEPTNDLDIETLDLLEQVINDFEGTILLVSHDRLFLEHIVTSTLVFEGDGRVTEYVGGYEDYLRQSGTAARDPGSPTSRPAEGSPTTDPGMRNSGSGTRTPDPGSQLRKKLTFNEVRELESLPARIDSLESEQSRLQTEAASPEFYKESPEHIRQVLARIDAIAPELDAALARWMELEERR
jgi:ATP-binding cassette subfamily F protein uup